VCNDLIDEKIFWGRVAGCHSETVSTAQNPLAASYQKSEKMKRFWIENWQRKPVVTQKKQKRLQIWFVYLYESLTSFVSPCEC
jgi:hypothetical protein